MAKGTTATDLRSKGDAELADLLKTAKNQIFEARFQNYTNRLNDTSRLRKLRTEIARLNTVIRERARSAQTSAEAKKGEG